MFVQAFSALKLSTSFQKILNLGSGMPDSQRTVRATYGFELRKRRRILSEFNVSRDGKNNIPHCYLDKDKERVSSKIVNATF